MPGSLPQLERLCLEEFEPMPNWSRMVGTQSLMLATDVENKRQLRLDLNVNTAWIARFFWLAGDEQRRSA